jgi:glycosyltransferase involved in cell wall biosynthesis
MRVLFVTPFLPYPPDGDGTKLIIWNLAEELSRRSKLSLLCFGPLDASSGMFESVKGLFPTIEMVPLDEGALGKVNAMAKSARSGRPYAVEKFSSALMSKQLARLLHSGTFDAVHVDTYAMAQYIPPMRQIPFIVAPHDSRSLTLRELLRFGNRLTAARRFYLQRELRLMERYEARVYMEYDACVVVAEPDRSHLLGLNPLIKTHVIPNGVRLTSDSYTPPEEHCGVVFVGDMGYGPNIEAAVGLAVEVFPRVRELIPQAKLFIVGRNPAKPVLSLHSLDKGVIVTGEVSDVRSYIRRCAVSVAPVRYGSGVKNKVLDALSLGRRVIAYPSACFGLADGYRDFVTVVESPQGMIQEIVHALQGNNDDRGTERIQFVRDNHSWKATAEQFEILYQGRCK